MKRPARPGTKKATPAPKAAAPKPKPEPKRARDDDGHYVPDDPATTEVNEAFEGGKPLSKGWSVKDTKATLLNVALDKGLDLSMDNTKAEIVAALEEAES